MNTKEILGAVGIVVFLCVDGWGCAGEALSQDPQAPESATADQVEDQPDAGFGRLCQTITYDPKTGYSSEWLECPE